MIKHIRIKTPGEIKLILEGTTFTISFSPTSKGEGHIRIHKAHCQTEVVLIGQAMNLGFYVSWKEVRNVHEYAFHLSKEYAQHHAGELGIIFEPKQDANTSLLVAMKGFIIRPIQPTTT